MFVWHSQYEKFDRFKVRQDMKKSHRVIQTLKRSDFQAKKAAAPLRVQPLLLHHSQ
jgi:hypothetical protein